MRIPALLFVVALAQAPQTAEYRITEVRVTNARLIRPDFILGGFGLKVASLFSEAQLKADIENLRRLYGSLGYAEFFATPVLDFDEQQKLVKVTVNLEEGRQFKINRITFSGNTKTADATIRREIQLIEGFVFSSQGLEISLMRLNRLGLFEEIKLEDVAVKTSPVEPRLDIEFRLKEKN